MLLATVPTRSRPDGASRYACLTALPAEDPEEDSAEVQDMLEEYKQELASLSRGYVLGDLNCVSAPRDGNDQNVHRSLRHADTTVDR